MSEHDTSHLPEIRLVQLARAGEEHPHLKACAFCREQYDALREMLIGARIADDTDAVDATTRFRLAAQSETATAEDQRWRQTWYLEDGALVIRVLEDIPAEELVGYCIGDPDRYPNLRIRFSGIDAEFAPDPQGRFVIGSPALAIEPMRISVEERS